MKPELKFFEDIYYLPVQFKGLLKEMQFYAVRTAHRQVRGTYILSFNNPARASREIEINGLTSAQDLVSSLARAWWVKNRLVGINILLPGLLSQLRPQLNLEPACCAVSLLIESLYGNDGCVMYNGTVSLAVHIHWDRSIT